ncbi:hypothetical protein QN277_002159 [Acacia crassicarpa]|uniref:F-box domain-containing protein n=1 Tax=Acacia crassicarpa TaxID=499986 RepID=A0AAE1N8Q1_9FABA|nr:hypothetical protein QN277_002159 [Acacia crassicarpa]
MEVVTTPVRLPDDILALISSKLPIRARVLMIPLVCKSWAQVLTRRDCWKEIDLFPWIDSNDRRLRHTNLADKREKMVRMLVPRSSGLLHTLCVYGLESLSIFSLIAENGTRLRTLRIPESDITDPMVQQIAARFSMLTVLDVSKCMFLDAPGLALIGNNCRMLEELHRRMYLHFLDEVPPVYDDEATAIASTMPNLKFLDIGGHSINTEGVHMILGACSKLKRLCMWRCFNVQAQNLGLAKNRFPKLTVWGPQPTDSFILLGYHPLEPLLLYDFDSKF